MISLIQYYWSQTSKIERNLIKQEFLKQHTQDCSVSTLLAFIY